MDRREWLGSTAALAAAAAWPRARAEERDTRTLRWPFRVAETGFDPPQVGDVNSALVLASIFESPLTYDYLARPVLLRPQVAVALPEVSADFTSFTFEIRPGLFFADDPVFNGKPRELVAQDFVYAVKRFYDPKLNSEHLYYFENAKLLGLSEVRREACSSSAVSCVSMAVAASRARSVKDSATVRPCTVIRRFISSRLPVIVSVRPPTSREMRSATSLPRVVTSSRVVRRAPRVSSISRVRLSTVVDRVSAVRWRNSGSSS